MADYCKYYEAREIISSILYQDFVGPVFDDEVLAELPTQYYIMGKLYPQTQDGEVLDLVRNPFLENDMESYDASISLSDQKNPSSLGITCTLKSNVRFVNVSGNYSFYLPIEYEDADLYEIDTEKWENKEKKPKEFWVRQEQYFEKKIELPSKNNEKSIDLSGGIQLKVYTPAVFQDGECVVTFVLVNTNVTSGDAIERARLCAFQVEMRIQGEDGSIFSNVNHQSNLSTDEELLELEMLYSDVQCYGQGHGCSVIWDKEHPEPLWVASSWMPSFNLKQMMATQIENNQVLSMKYLSEALPSQIINSLREFICEYKLWIENIEVASELLSDRYKTSAKRNIEKCRDAYERIYKSISMLDESVTGDKKAFQSFQLANKAMLVQRKQTLNKAGKVVDDEKIYWYPFQLAFLLHEMSSFINPESQERKVVDLLWFPTGGGKTEAYLGITAFVIFLRRLKNCDDDGVTVIMRYTLRLLTIQQFERASMLIIACEFLRKKYNIGGKEFSIGLWVGGKLTPNALCEARLSINKQQRGAIITSNETNPCQIQVCPWCGKPLTAHNYSVKINEKRMLIKCSNPECETHILENGLPLHIIDEDIYEHMPTFIVATVDKFAQIPLSDKPAALFGISTGKNPPELIIQDELHLISGPLGTMTGIYEAAITKLCEKNGIGAKIIASTATIRNAKRQIKALYGKEYVQFPPQGITAKDSYFAIESTTENRPAREYFGVMGIGTTATTTLIRVNAALLFATRYLVGLGFEDKVIDNFWTITGYFNSLRELGGASTQIMDDVQSRFLYLANTKFSSLSSKVDSSKKYDYFEELTSRMNNSEITKIIQDRLKREYHNGHHKDVYDFILASNMISVGVDVSRLGTMVVAGQPKTNAEYIQATSRVGRDNPGVVITIYNSARSRDRSHYEQFLKYHSALYKYVEATSLTPFADRARDRGLHALYVALCRYLVPGMLQNESAKNYNPEDENIKKIEEIILNYVQEVDANEYDAVLNELLDIEDEWHAVTCGSLVYKSFSQEKKLLQNDVEESRFRTMNSMRNVDAQAGIYLLGR